jgi:hypothetical protein
MCFKHDGVTLWEGGGEEDALRPMKTFWSEKGGIKGVRRRFFFIKMMVEPYSFL